MAAQRAIEIRRRQGPADEGAAGKLQRFRKVRKAFTGWGATELDAERHDRRHPLAVERGIAPVEGGTGAAPSYGPYAGLN